MAREERSRWVRLELVWRERRRGKASWMLGESANRWSSFRLQHVGAVLYTHLSSLKTRVTPEKAPLHLVREVLAARASPRQARYSALRWKRLWDSWKLRSLHRLSARAWKR